MGCLQVDQVIFRGITINHREITPLGFVVNPFQGVNRKEMYIFIDGAFESNILGHVFRYYLSSCVTNPIEGGGVSCQTNLFWRDNPSRICCITFSGSSRKGQVYSL